MFIMAPRNYLRRREKKWSVVSCSSRIDGELFLQSSSFVVQNASFGYVRHNTSFRESRASAAAKNRPQVAALCGTLLAHPHTYGVWQPAELKGRKTCQPWIPFFWKNTRIVADNILKVANSFSVEWTCAWGRVRDNWKRAINLTL